MTTKTLTSRVRDMVLAAVLALLIGIGAASGLQALDQTAAPGSAECDLAADCDSEESFWTITGWSWR